MRKRIGFALIIVSVIMAVVACRPDNWWEDYWWPDKFPGEDKPWQPIEMTDKELIEEMMREFDPQSVLREARNGRRGDSIWSEVLNAAATSSVPAARNTVQSGTYEVLVHFDDYKLGEVTLEGVLKYSFDVPKSNGVVAAFRVDDVDGEPLQIRGRAEESISVTQFIIPDTVIEDPAAVVFVAEDDFIVSDSQSMNKPMSSVISAGNESVTYDEVENGTAVPGNLSAEQVATLFSFEDLLYAFNEEESNNLTVAGLEIISGQYTCDFSVVMNSFDTGSMVITGILEGTATRESVYNTLLKDFSLSTPDDVALTVIPNGDTGSYRVTVDISGSANANANAGGLMSKDSDTYLRPASLNGTITVNGTSVPVADSRGSGTESDPYMIYTPGELHSIIRYLASNEAEDKLYVRLGHDIDLASYPYADWYTDKLASYDFDGDGHAINGLDAYFSKSIDAESRIRDVVFTEKTKHSITETLYGTIENVAVESGKISVDRDTYTGSIADSMEDGAVIRNAVNHADVENTGTGSNSRHTGGIVGLFNGGTVENVRNYGNISDSRENAEAGGIIGRLSGEGSHKIDKAINYGNVTAHYAGGIAGYLFKTADISYVENRGDIKGINAGGIIGNMSTSLSVTKIMYAINSGSVDGSSSSGGISTGVSSPVEIIGAMNTGAISGGAAAGIAHSEYHGAGNETASVKASYSSGEIDTTGTAGGIIVFKNDSINEYFGFDACYFSDAENGAGFIGQTEAAEIDGITKISGDVDWIAAQESMNEVLKDSGCGFVFADAAADKPPVLPSVEQFFVD